MSRGEPVGSSGRGPGVAIFAAFGVLCLAATLLVVWTTQDCSGMFGVPATTTPEAFPGAHAALGPLGSRDCATATGPSVGPPTGVVGGPAARSSVEGLLEARGYVPGDAGWSTPEPLPLEATASSLEGSCGLVAVVVEAGGYVDRQRGEDGRWRDPSCNTAYALVPACDSDRWAVEGAGSASVRTFVVPGLSAETARGIGIPLDVLLAHAEAEAHLRTLGWKPADEIVVRDLSAGSAPVLSQRPPAAPSSGCIGWVAVGRGLGTANTWWAHYTVDTDPAMHGFTVGLVSCAPDPTVVTTETRLEVTDHDGGGGRIWFRPYAPASGPSVPAGAPAAPRGIASVRPVTSALPTLPDSVPMNEPQ